MALMQPFTRFCSAWTGIIAQCAAFTGLDGQRSAQNCIQTTPEEAANLNATDNESTLKMDLSKIVYAFQTGSAKKVFALTYEKSGSNLPTDRVWRYWKPFDNARVHDDAQKALVDHGFWTPSEMPEPEVIEPVLIKPRIAKKR